MARFARIILFLLAGVLCLGLATTPRVNPAVGVTERFNRDVALASSATYISLRAINAALSAVQEVEVGASFGASGSLQPLKWLEPVDDTVERVSDLIFVVALVNGVLSLAIGPLASIGFFLLAVGLIGRCGCETRRAGWAAVPGSMRRTLAGCGTLGFALAVALPVAVALGAWAGEVLTAADWTEASATIAAIADDARAMIGEPDAAGDDRGWRETLGAYMNAGATFWEEADSLLLASLTLGGIFLLRMVVLPAVIFVAFLYLLRQWRPGGGPF